MIPCDSVEFFAKHFKKPITLIEHLNLDYGLLIVDDIIAIISMKSCAELDNLKNCC
jgi:hypothetical protein